MCAPRTRRRSPPTGWPARWPSRRGPAGRSGWTGPVRHRTAPAVGRRGRMVGRWVPTAGRWDGRARMTREPLLAVPPETATLERVVAVTGPGEVTIREERPAPL